MGFVVESHRRWWPGGIVPFEFARDLTDEDRAAIREVMRAWSELAPVRFVARDGESRFVRIRERGFAEEYKAGRSVIGRRRCSHSVRVASAGLSHVVFHELGHAIGLLHEHQRPDRDDFVVVRPEREPAARSNLRVRSGRTVGPYDPGSVMHYDMFGRRELRLPRRVRSVTSTPDVVGSVVMLLGEDGTLELRAGDTATLGDPFRKERIGAAWTHVFRADVAGHVAEFRFATTDGRWESAWHEHHAADALHRDSGSFPGGPFRDVAFFVDASSRPVIAVLTGSHGEERSVELHAFRDRSRRAPVPDGAARRIVVPGDTESLLHVSESRGSAGPRARIRILRVVRGVPVAEDRTEGSSEIRMTALPEGFRDVCANDASLIAHDPASGRLFVAPSPANGTSFPEIVSETRLPAGMRLLHGSAGLNAWAEGPARDGAVVHRYYYASDVSPSVLEPVIVARRSTPPLVALGGREPSAGDVAAADVVCQGDLHVLRLAGPGRSARRRATFLTGDKPRDVHLWATRAPDGADGLVAAVTATRRPIRLFGCDADGRNDGRERRLAEFRHDGAGVLRGADGESLLLLRRDGDARLVTPDLLDAAARTAPLRATLPRGFTHACGFAPSPAMRGTGPARAILVDGRTGHWTCRALTGSAGVPGAAPPGDAADPAGADATTWFGEELASGRMADGADGVVVFTVPTGPAPSRRTAPPMGAFVAILRASASPEIRPWRADGTLGDAVPAATGNAALPPGARVAACASPHPGDAQPFLRIDVLVVLDPLSGSVTIRRVGPDGVPLAPDPLDAPTPGSDLDAAGWAGDAMRGLAAVCPGSPASPASPATAPGPRTVFAAATGGPWA